MPPHVYAVSDNAYNDMLRNRENQSMLITGNRLNRMFDRKSNKIFVFAHIFLSLSIFSVRSLSLAKELKLTSVSKYTNRLVHLEIACKLLKPRN